MIDTDTASATSTELYTPTERHLFNEILHDEFPRTVEKDLHQQQGPGVVSPQFNYWVVTDRRTGKAMYGHA